MAIYVILDNDIRNDKKYEAYKAAVPALVARHGGEYLARDGKFEVLVGNWKPNRIVIFRWPSREAMQAFLNDPDYQPWKTLRESVATTTNLMVIEGL
jgi:uncharacterized protein (DUF1330 family)